RPGRRDPGDGRGQAVHACPTGSPPRPRLGWRSGARRSAADRASRGGGRAAAAGMIPPRVVLATENPGKVRELSVLLADLGVAEVVSLAAFPGVRCPPET